MLAKTTGLLDKLVINEEQLLKNLNLTRGLVFSGQLLLELAAAGAQREEAYYWVQRNALNSWDNGLDFRELVTNDPDISKLLTPDKIERAFDVKTRLKNIDRVFERVFGK